MIIIIIIQKFFYHAQLVLMHNMTKYPQMKLGDIRGYTPSTKLENSAFKI